MFIKVYFLAYRINKVNEHYTLIFNFHLLDFEIETTLVLSYHQHSVEYEQLLFDWKKM